MDCASGWRRWKDCSLRKASLERLYPMFSKRGAPRRYNKLVDKISDAVSVPKEVTECRCEKQKPNGKIISSKERPPNARPILRNCRPPPLLRSPFWMVSGLPANLKWINFGPMGNSELAPGAGVGASSRGGRG